MYPHNGLWWCDGCNREYWQEGNSWFCCGVDGDARSVHFEASSCLFDRWRGKASDNIEKWGLQREETLLLAIQEELGELTQAHLEATHEGGDPGRVAEELDDLGALLIQLYESHRNRSLQAGTEGDRDV
ncbi:hypothetical protein [Natronosalvus rutilus]|uniref:Uncharacterized protein n=1 Tax=Natronosalvus rutilus TaxID=2953753 RepID=A0A9E7N7B4_9EURY|nr:hypothetical protein [Natronosalvus rutilus]UTF52830.1 hypothetical protein NGM29_13715 [Natronosalvus rutilus]